MKHQFTRRTDRLAGDVRIAKSLIGEMMIEVQQHCIGRDQMLGSADTFSFGTVQNDDTVESARRRLFGLDDGVETFQEGIGVSGDILQHNAGSFAQASQKTGQGQATADPIAIAVDV